MTPRHGRSAFAARRHFTSISGHSATTPGRMMTRNPHVPPRAAESIAPAPFHANGTAKATPAATWTASAIARTWAAEYGMEHLRSGARRSETPGSYSARAAAATYPPGRAFRRPAAPRSAANNRSSSGDS